MPTVNMLEARSTLLRLVGAVEVRRREGDHHRPQRPACCEVGGNQASPDRQADRGVAKGKFVVPDTIDTDDEAAITALFTGKPE